MYKQLSILFPVILLLLGFGFNSNAQTVKKIQPIQTQKLRPVKKKIILPYKFEIQGIKRISTTDKFDFLVDGNFRVSAKINPQKIVTESNYNNNSFTYNFVIPN
ncbi:MAG: hypothetical protein GY757_36085 [bacterium]|nr:hypothetical protein [bacterium]